MTPDDFRRDAPDGPLDQRPGGEDEPLVLFRIRLGDPVDAARPAGAVISPEDDPLVPVRIRFGDLVVNTAWPASLVEAGRARGEGDEA